MDPFNTKRPLPCEKCNRTAVCAVEKTDCFAFRRWVNCGDYSDRQVAHIVREMVEEEEA